MRQRVIVIGAGQWGKNLVRTFNGLNALAAIAEYDSGLRDLISKEYPGIPLYSDYKEAIEKTDPAGVVIATPAPSHYEIAVYALREGKDVFVEKPITLSSREAEELLQTAERAQRLLMVGHLLIYQPAIQKIKEIIENGVIGNLKSLHQERMKLGRVRSVENVLWSFGVHDIAVLLYLTGQIPIDVQARGQSILQPGIEDDVYVHLGFNHGIAAHLHTSWLWPELRRRLIVIGDKGMIVYDEEKQTVTLHRKGVHQDLSNRDEGSELVLESTEQPLMLECKHFLNAMETRDKPLSDGKNGLEVVRILEKAARCLKGWGNNE